MVGETKTVVVAVVEQDGCRLSASCDEDSALTLIGIASEDPASWSEIAACWSRYRTPPVPEFADGLATQTVSFSEVLAAIGEHGSWLVIDLVQKRIMTGRDFGPVGRDQAFVLHVDKSGKERYPVSVHLPPWWEMHEAVEPNALHEQRTGTWSVPRVDREILFGQVMIDSLAARILNIVQSDAWRSGSDRDSRQALYQHTVQVHREWLMTPLDELEGRYPRELLHGGIDWIDSLISAQQIRVQDGGELVALPTDMTGYDGAPMGREEVVMYFDLCRELISAGWQWCIENSIGVREATDPTRTQLLALHLAEVKQRWLASPFEGGAAPQFIIECSRRRVPHGPGISIVGMDNLEPDQHVIDCNCPICNMMAEGLFGPCFEAIDGYHLELDDEFAFSLNATREEWEAEQADNASFSASMATQMAKRQEYEPQEPDELAPVWSGQLNDEPIPGDSRGHLKLAFLLAEVVGVLESKGVQKQVIRRLNDKFTRFRQSDRRDLFTSGRELNEELEALTSGHFELITRAADLQSRITELMRRPELIEDDR